MLSTSDLGPVVNVLRAAVGFGLFIMVVKPENTRSYRRRFWATVVVIAGITITGLRPLLTLRIDTWAGYASLFQCIFNVAIIGLLLLRYRVHMPRDQEPVQKASAH